VECFEVREVYLLANSDVGQRLRVSKDGIQVVSVLSTRGVTRPDGKVKFCKIILQKGGGPYDVSQ